MERCPKCKSGSLLRAPEGLMAVCDSCHEIVDLPAEISRRRFIEGLGGIALKTIPLAFAVSSAVKELIEELHAEEQEAAARARRSVETERLFAEIFGLAGELRSVSFGRKNYSAGLHPDNRAGGAGLLGPMGLLDTPNTENKDLAMSLDGNAIFVGGSTSTPLSRIVFETEGQGDYDLRRPEERGAVPILKLPVHGVSDASLTAGLIGRTMQGVGDVVGPRWAFVCTDPVSGRTERKSPTPGRQVVKSSDGQTGPVPTDDYLLVTRLPNFLSPAFLENLF